MEFGVSVGHISAVDYAQHGERLGFTRCWVTDSPLIRSNLFATMAAIALQTRTIQIGAGVAVCGMRLAPEAANGVATVNALAPGRTFAIFGTGNTAMRMLGLRAIAGELADGLCTTLPRGGTVTEAMANVRRGAAKVGRTLPAGFHTSALVNVLMLEPGESLTSARVIAEIGPAVMTNFHSLVDWVRESGKEPPPYVRSVWDDYMQFRRARAAGDAHLTMHASHYASVDPDEVRFLTPEIIRAFCIVGEPDELVERLRQLEREGLKQITFHPPFERRYEVMERFSRLVMAKM